MAAILKSKMVVSGNDIVRFFNFMTICIRQFPCCLCYIELSSLYLKVAKSHENNINNDLQICTRPTCRGSLLCDGIRKQNIFQPEVFFSPIYKLLKKMVYLEVCKFEKNTSGLEIFFFANTIA